jgi:hypothetical protein
MTYRAYEAILRPLTYQAFGKPFFFLSLLLCTVHGARSTAYAISNNAGSTNGDFLKIATDARGVALGDSVISMAEGAAAVHNNPAGLSSLTEKEAMATDVQYYQGVTMQNIAFAYPLEESALAANVFYLSPGTLDGRDTVGNQTGSFAFHDLVASLAYGRKMLTRAEGMDVSIGATLKIVQETIAEQTFQNPALDVGASVSPLDDLNIALDVRNLSTSKANFSREIIGGASYTMFRVFTGAFAVNYSNDAPLRASVGGEYKIPQLDSVIRAGYQTHDPLDNSIDSQIPGLRGASLAGLTMGAGLDYKPPMFPTLKLAVDYAMAPFGALGISHTITLRLRW